MVNAESFVWWFTSSLTAFAAIFVLSRWFGARAPRAFQILWLICFIKLVLPIGLWSPWNLVPSVDLAGASLERPDAAMPTSLKSAEPPAPSFRLTESGASEVSSDAGTEWLLPCLLGAWAMGSILLLALSLRDYRRLARRPDLGPVTAGLLKPQIRLPNDFERHFTALEQELIIAHERVHIRVRDPLWLAFVQALTCVFWWLPVVWWARSEFQTVTELACDQSVLRHRSTNEARVYGQLLVRLATQPLQRRAVAFAGSFTALHRRVSAIARPLRWRGTWVLVTAFILGSGLGALSLSPTEPRWVWPIPEVPENPQSLEDHDSPAPSQLAVIELREGTPVLATDSGEITGLTEDAGHGWKLTLEHSGGFRSVYGNLEPAPNLHLGLHVERASTIGKVYAPTAAMASPLTFRLEHGGATVDLARTYPAFKELVHPTFLDRALVWPLAAGRGTIDDRFGISVHPFTGKLYFHKGTDASVELGTEVRSVAEGTVVRVEYEALGYGWYVDIDHGNGRVSRYAHLMNVNEDLFGKKVMAGQSIGRAGATGLASGPHLHWELRVSDRLIDPLRVSYQP